MFKKPIIILSILAILMPTFVLADGMLIPPPDRFVYETGQKAVIFYEDGTEKLVLSTTFKGDAEDFAWIIPTPNKPEVSKSSDELFSSLEKLTTPPIDYNRPQPLSGFGLMDSAQKESAVQVIETKKVDYYDITVLTAEDKEALSKWLNDHEYKFPEDSSYVLDSYIKDRWYFTAIKIDASSLTGQVAQQFKDGHAIPLQLVFKTDKPVYPLKISSVVNDNNNTSPKNEPTYLDGKSGKMVKLNKNEYLTYYHNSEVDLSHGTISLWLKPDKNFAKGNGDIFYLFGQPTIIEDQTDDKNNYNYFPPRSNPNNYLRIYKNSNFLDFYLKLLPNQYVVWVINSSAFKENEFNHLVLSWQANETPLLYINDQAITLDQNKKVPAVGEIKVSNLTYNIGKITDYSNAIYNRTFNLYLDELQIYQKALTGQEIEDIYTKGGADLNNDTIFLAHFDDNLTIENSKGTWEKFTFIDSKPKSYYPKPTNVNIILYTFTRDKKQQVAGFNTDYAGWIKKDEIKNLASLDNGNPWLEPAGNKYYLTRLSKNMSYSEMSYDLYLKDASDNNTVNYTETSERGMVLFWVVAGIAIFITLILSIALFIFYRR